MATALKNLALLGSALFLVLAPALSAADYDAAVGSCLDSVNDSLDLDGASRVRHVVSLKKSTGIGKVLEIETRVTGPDGVRRFSSYCVASGASQPLKFRINERADG